MSNLKWQELIPLRQKNVDEYIPSIQQIIQYAEFIGLQFPGDQKLLYLAKQGITASLPDQWQACQTINGDMVYRNIITKQVQQQHPLDLIYRKKVLQLKHQPFQDYFSLEFDLGKKTQGLPAIEQEKGELSQSSFSDHFDTIGKISFNKTISQESKNRNNKILPSQLIQKPSSELKNHHNKQSKQKIAERKRKESNLLNYFSKSYSSNEISQQQNNSFSNKLSKPMISKQSQQKSKLYPKPLTSQQIYSSREHIKLKPSQKSQNLVVNNKQINRNQNEQEQNLNQFIDLDDDKSLQSKKLQSFSNYFINDNYKLKNQKSFQQLQEQLKNYQMEKQLKFSLLNQIKQSNNLKINLIKRKLHKKYHKKKNNQNNQQLVNQINK